jgi:ribonuclease HII
MQKNTNNKPTFEIEKHFQEQGFELVAGADEVGRGALAGPIFAAAAIFDIEKNFRGIRKIKDSKLLKAKEREEILKYIRKNVIDSAIGSASVEEINKHGIGAANIMAFKRALDNLKSVDFAIIDGRQFRGFAYKYFCVEKGDNKSISIAAASIIAKVERDKLMSELDPSDIYGFKNNKGYGAKKHQEALKSHGPSEHHRTQFIRGILNSDPKLF